MGLWAFNDKICGCDYEGGCTYNLLLNGRYKNERQIMKEKLYNVTQIIKK